MLFINCYRNYVPEREYICSVILKEFLGVPYTLNYWDKREWSFTDATGTKQVTLPDVFFQIPQKEWLTPASLPAQPLNLLNVEPFCPGNQIVNGGIPAIYGPAHSTPYDIPLDILGSAFFMLTRYEEVVKKDRDRHTRFPAGEALAHQEGFLDRPIINEYLELLWHCLKRLWPGLERKSRKFQILPSHDVDHPFKFFFKKPRTLLSEMISGQIKPQEFPTWLSVLRGHSDRDPFNTFDWIMDVSEKNSLTSSFFFIPDSYAGEKQQSNYALGDPLIRSILANIHSRNHAIGYHASYHAFTNATRIKEEFMLLQKHATDLGVQQETWGGRHHYLRWDPITTWRDWDLAGITYDSSLMYAEQVGFRCGVCYDYPVYDVTNRRALQLREIPLIVMDSSVTDPLYMNKDTGEAHQYMVALKRQCQRFKGYFTILWHNSQLERQDQRYLYESVLTT